MICSMNLTITELRSPISSNGRQVVKCQKVTGFSLEKNHVQPFKE